MRSPRFTPWLLVATLTAAGAAAALGYGLTAPKHYRATATILVSPVAASESAFTGLDVLRDAGGRSAAASAAALVKTPQVADAARSRLGLRRSSGSLLDAIDIGVARDGRRCLGRLRGSACERVRRRVDRAAHLELPDPAEQLLRATHPGAEANELGRRLAPRRRCRPRPPRRTSGSSS